MGLGFRVGSGVRVYGGGRGLGVSVGKGPLRYYTRVGGGSRSRGTSTRTSVATHERQVRQAQKLEEVQGALDLDNQLVAMCQAHKEDFEKASKPSPEEAEPVDIQAVRNRLIKEAQSGISALKLGQRREAKAQALERLDEEIEQEKTRATEEAKERAERWDRYWTALEANDESVVLPTLEQAFEHNEAPAAAVSCRDSRVDIVMRWPGLDDVVPERKAAVTPTGKPTIKKRSKGERAELYLEAISSHALATAKETIAVCPYLDTVGMAIVRAGHDPARGDEILEPIVFGVLQCADLESLNWANISATAAFLSAAEGRIGMRGKGSNKTLFGLGLNDDSEGRDFITQVAAGLEARVPDDGIDGIPLPVRVVVG
jgi:hypothetical protein